MSGLHDLFLMDFLGKEDNLYCFSCNINTKHPVFSGHFPQMPIVPGVCLLNAAKQAVTQITGKSALFSEVRECKFLSAINPIQNSNFLLKLEIGENAEIRANIFVKSTQCMKLKAFMSI